MRRIASPPLILLLVLASFPAFGAATITIVNVDGAGEGFNDPTPAAPIGGNPGTTVGQQRLLAFQFAADTWGNLLDSAAEIRIQASFDPLTCTAASAVLGSAGTITVLRDFPGAEFPATWYHIALANKLLGFDAINPGDDIRARFNSSLNGNPACLGGIGWYYGFDNIHGANIDLVTVLLHEFAHGLGFATFVNQGGSQLAGFADIFERHIFDDSTSKHWIDMTNAERAASTLNPRHVSWDGATVTAAVPGVLDLGTPFLRVTSPAAIAGDLSVGTASFGAPISSPGVTGQIVQALDPADAAGPTTFDGCSPLTNAAAVSGNIALIDRGTCGFIVKVKNAQNAGAIAALIADNVAGAPPSGLGGTDPTITIPSARISLADGIAIRAQLGAGVTASLLLDLSLRSGADAANRALLFTPSPFQGGSSVSHWDTIEFPNQLMEPAINADLTHNPQPPNDLTLPQLRDIGWFPDADLDGVPDNVDCEPNSNFAPTVVIGRCDSGVPNTLFTTGCTISDLINKCAAGAGNHGGFASCVAHLGNDLKKAGIISGSQKGAIQSCAAGASIP